MSVGNTDALLAVSHGPDNDTLIKRTRSQTLRVGGPGNGLDGSSVEAPSLLNNGPVSGAPDDDLVLLVTGGKVLSARGESSRGDLTGVTVQDLGLLEGVTSQRVKMDLEVITTTDSSEVGGGVDSGTLGAVVSSHLGDLLLATEEVDALHGSGDSEITRSDGTVHGGRVDGGGVSVLTVQVGDTEGVVHGAGDELVVLDGHTVDLIGVSLSGDDFVGASVDVPAGDDGIVGSSVEAVGLLVVGHGGDELVVSLQHLLGGVGLVLVQVVEVTVQTQGDHVVTLPQDTLLHVLEGVGELEGGDALLSLNIPKLDALVTRASQKLGTLGVPGHRVDTHLVLLGELTLLLTSLTIVQEDLLVLTSRGQNGTGGVETDTVHETSVVGQVLLPLEWGTLEPLARVVLGTGDKTEGTGLLHVASGQLLGSTRDLTNRGTSLGKEDTTVLLLTVTNNGKPLGVRRPRDISDGTEDNVDLQLANTVSTNAIPDPHGTRRVTRGNVVPRRSITSDGRGMSMLGVLIADERVGEITNHNRVSGAIQDVLALGVTAQMDGETSRGGRERGIEVLYFKGKGRGGEKKKKKKRKGGGGGGLIHHKINNETSYYIIEIIIISVQQKGKEGNGNNQSFSYSLNPSSFFTTFFFPPSKILTFSFSSSLNILISIFFPHFSFHISFLVLSFLNFYFPLLLSFSFSFSSLSFFFFQDPHGSFSLHLE